jgi:hypothetical protein
VPFFLSSSLCVLQLPRHLLVVVRSVALSKVLAFMLPLTLPSNAMQQPGTISEQVHILQDTGIEPLVAPVLQTVLIPVLATLELKI